MIRRPFSPARSALPRSATRPPILIAGFVAAALVLTGCSASGSSSTSSSSATASTKLVEQLPKATGDIDTLNWDLPKGEPTTIDPSQAVDYSPDLVVSNMCDPLLRQGADSKNTPYLASKYDQVNPLTLVFTIRDDVKFWDGKSLTPEDVVYSMKRVMGPTAPLSFVYANVKSISVTGAHQVTVSFKTPDELFLKEMSTPAGLVVEKAYAEAQGSKFGTAAGGVMCSGPLEFSSWKAGSSITLTKNDSYWNSTYKSHSKKVVLSFVSDTSAVTQGLLSGEFDGAYEIPASVIPSLQSSKSGRVTFGPSQQSLSFVIANPGGATASVKLRKAIQTAIDRKSIASQAFHGAATANYTYMSTAAWDLDTSDQYAAAYKKYEKSNAFDPAAAKKLVKESGYSGAKLTIGVLAGDTTSSTVAELIQQEAADIGVTMVIKQLQPLAFSAAGTNASGRKGLDYIINYAFNQVPDPMEFMGIVVAPGIYNWADYDDPSAVADLTKAQQIFDATERTKLILAAQAKYESQYPATSLFGLHETSYLSDKLTGAITSFPYLFSPSLALIGSK